MWLPIIIEKHHRILTPYSLSWAPSNWLLELATDPKAMQLAQRAHRGCFVPSLPQDGRTSLWAGNIVYRVLHDEVAVGTANGESTPGASLAYYH